MTKVLVASILALALAGCFSDGIGSSTNENQAPAIDNAAQDAAQGSQDGQNGDGGSATQQQ